MGYTVSGSISSISVNNNNININDNAGINNNALRILDTG